MSEHRLFYVLPTICPQNFCVHRFKKSLWNVWLHRSGNVPAQIPSRVKAVDENKYEIEEKIYTLCEKQRMIKDEFSDVYI